jgi:hypothetical protein
MMHQLGLWALILKVLGAMDISICSLVKIQSLIPGSWGFVFFNDLLSYVMVKTPFSLLYVALNPMIATAMLCVLSINVRRN